MHLKVTSPERIVFEGNVKKINIPSENGYLGIMPGHVPLTSVVKPGILRITVPAEKKDHLIKSADFLFDENQDIVLSISRGLLFLDGENVLVVTSAATTTLMESEEILLENKRLLEKEIEEVKVKGSLEEIEKVMLDLEKIHADLKLYKMKGIVK